MKFILFAFLLMLVVLPVNNAYPQQGLKRILVLTEGKTDIKSFAMADGRQLAELLGHFNTKTDIKGVNQYSHGEINDYDYTFYIGYNLKNKVPAAFLNDVLTTNKQIIWIYTGFAEFSKTKEPLSKFGFSVTGYDSTTGYDMVKSNNRLYTKGDYHVALIDIKDKKNIQVYATTYSSKRRREIPYIIRSKNLVYVGDSPFAYADETDRYLLFADMLHDILGEQHKESHSALLRIEDISPMDNPDKLRDIADVLSERGIPFLVGVIPFYVDPGSGLRLSLSDKPELVDALKYMVKNGATLVMHGSTHQYKGVTASDFEFWDESTNKPIKGETEGAIAKKLELGITEMMKNGLYPLLWETPHYTASFQLYSTVAKYFSTAMEQRLACEDYDHSQYFPYIINKDLFGQKIIPENLGYIPLDPNKDISRQNVLRVIKGAKSNLYVRDGFASCFFHEFLDLDLLKELVDGVRALGYTYIDIKDETNWVKTKDHIILTGSQNYTLNIQGQYLAEAVYGHDGEVKSKGVSKERFTGIINKHVELTEGEIYKAEPVEFKEHQESFVEKISKDAKEMFNNIFTSNKDWKAARPVILWNHFSRGAAYNDQASLASVFRSVNIKVDTIFAGEKLNLSKYNLVIVPFGFVDSLTDQDYTTLSLFVEKGGNLITDTKTELSTELGFKFLDFQIKVSRLRERLFPEERISWRNSELVNKIEVQESDEVFSYDENSDMPMAVGRTIGKGKVLFFNSRFDPYSVNGYSLYPYLMEYVRRYFNQRPVIRRDNLEVYFDPGFRHTYSVENLIKQWVTQGIRIIHVAGWHEYPKYTYDYKRLIDLAHGNGMLVYAWIEPPQVSLKFWTEHPEWREKNIKGEDVRPSWRYPVALTDDNCLSAIEQKYKDFLNKFDWDGVNLAELYFESGVRGYEDAKLFTPMHPSARAKFKALNGFDPQHLFEQTSENYWKYNTHAKELMTQFRINQLDKVYERLLTSFNNIAAKKRGFEVVVTAMDSYGSPEVIENIGVDMENIIKLQKRYNFSLQVEDPENRWSTDPFRYIEMGNFYSKLLGGKTKLLLDLNILSFRKETSITPFPTLIQTGTESYNLVNAASLGAPRYTIYSESSVNSQDLSFFPYAAASEVEYKYLDNGFEFNSPYSFTVKLPDYIKEVSVDGYPISSFRDNHFTVPAGKHNVTFADESMASFSTHELQARILSFTGNLLSVSYGFKDLNFAYESDIRTLISVNREPIWIKVDGNEYKFEVMKGNDCFSVFLPPGKHSVEMGAGDNFSFGINLTSLWSSTGIAIFGSLAVSMLFMMFLFLKVYRRKFSGA